jgi:predicted acetyltransferase
MSMTLMMNWVGRNALDRVAETRWKCYAHAGKDLAHYKEGLQADPWGRDGDYLLAERDGEAVGTATSLPLVMWVRGSAISCQGVAYVGTIKSARRRGGSGPGVASEVMGEILRAGRERGHIVSALMPFRVSFYERFGYGVVERRAQWTIPLTVLPGGNCDGWRFLGVNDRAAQMAQWQMSVQLGQCDIERSANRWENWTAGEGDGMLFIDRPIAAGPARGMAFVTMEVANDRRILNVRNWSVESPAAFGGLLSFLGTLKDEFTAVKITGPVDWPINRMLREPQVPHRPVDHATPEVRMYTRMQLRVLDHRRYLESLHLPVAAKGRVSVAVGETEGDVSRFEMQIEGGRAIVKPSGDDVDFECTDRQWAAIATGDLAASEAARWGLARENRAGAAAILDALAVGPVPYCREYF